MEDDVDRRPTALAPGAVRCTLTAAALDGVQPSLLVHASDGTEYVFEVPESYARCALEHRTRPSARLKACFVRTTTSASIGGLTGLILRLSADGHERIAVVGPRGTTREVDAVRRCARFVHPKVDAVELDANSHLRQGDGIGCYADKSITVWPVFSSETECLTCDWERHRVSMMATNENSEDSTGVENDDDSRGSSDRAHEEGSESEGLLNTGTSATSDAAATDLCVGFVCEMRGANDSIGARFAVLNIDSISTLGKLNAHPMLSCVMKGKHALDALFHFSPTEILHKTEYQSWAKAICSRNFACRSEYDLAFRASARVTVRLNTADFESFPIPKSFLAYCNDASNKDIGTCIYLGLSSSVHVKHGDKAEIEQQSVHQSDLDIEAVLEELVVSRPELADAAHHSLNSLRDDITPNEIDDDSGTNKDVASALKARLLQGLGANKKQKSQVDPEVVFLGTGSAEPNKYRGSSGILIELPRPSSSMTKTWMLLDCGEGCTGALERLFGKNNMLHIVKHLKMIWISHHHADHMLGVRGILDMHVGVRPNEPLTVVGPSILKEWLQMSTVAKAAYRFVHSRELFAGPFGRLPPPPPSTQVNGASSSQTSKLNGNSRGAEVELLRITGLSRFEAVPVEHCRDAAALVMGCSTGWSLSYSGDCRPSRNFARAAKGCSVMIHEATFDNNLEDHAIRKRHSTTAEALQVANDANAEHIILTHFSQRYPKAINVDNVELELSQAPIIAFDGMRIRWSNLSASANKLHQVAAVLAPNDNAIS